MFWRPIAIVEFTSSDRSSLRHQALVQQHKLSTVFTQPLVPQCHSSHSGPLLCYVIASLQLKAAHTTQCNSRNSLQLMQLSATQCNFTLLIYENTTLFNTRSLSDPPGPNFYLISGFVPLTLLLKAYDQCIYDTCDMWEIRGVVGLVHSHFKIKMSEQTPSLDVLITFRALTSSWDQRTLAGFRSACTSPA